MPAIPVVAVFDIGKTNKKLFLFDEDYKIVWEHNTCFSEIEDDDGDPCEDLKSLEHFVVTSIQKVLNHKEFEIKAVNFSTYGASFVHLSESGRILTPLYNYLKEYPKDLLLQFYKQYGGEQLFSVLSASPVLGHLNSGMQLYWLKYAKPELYSKIHHSLHLPQYLSFLFTGEYFSELTSIGCHTNLWDFSQGRYHQWVQEEGVLPKLSTIVPTDHVVYPPAGKAKYVVGVGIHDSSAALIPYLSFSEVPFVLLSTGTWCITLNPFNQTLLTYEELNEDCLCYLSYKGRPVKASRLFAGNEHERQVQRLAAYFNKPIDYYKAVCLDINFLTEAQTYKNSQESRHPTAIPTEGSSLGGRDLESFACYEEAYHYFMMDLVARQVHCTRLVLNEPVKQLYVDGGFANNPIYMYLLANAFPEMEVYAAKMAQGSALGAALVIHSLWNKSGALPENIIETKCYSSHPNLLQPAALLKQF